MLGVRFLDADFMRINLACGCRLLSLYTFIEQSKRANWNEGSIATRRPGQSARARPIWQREIGEPNRAPIILADCSALGPR